MGKRECGSGVGSGSARTAECESVESGRGRGSEGGPRVRDEDTGSIGGASGIPRGRKDFVRACDRATRRRRRFREIDGCDDEIVLESHSRREDRRRVCDVTGLAVAGTIGLVFAAGPGQ